MTSSGAHEVMSGTQLGRTRPCPKSPSGAFKVVSRGSNYVAKVVFGTSSGAVEIQFGISSVVATVVIRSPRQKFEWRRDYASVAPTS